MAVNEISGFLKFKDANGDTNLLLPITTKDNVDGLDEIENNIDSLNEHAANGDIHFTADERNKLKNIEAGANKTVVDSAVSDTSTNPVQNMVIKAYVDDAISNIDIPSIDGLATESYSDTAATNAANKVKNDLLNGAGAAYDTLKELGDLIDDNQDAIDALETVASGKADAEHTHDWETIENRPFGEVPGTDTVYWDGNREGLVKAEGYDRYLVSTAVPTLADFENGASNTKLQSGTESTTNLGMGTAIYEAGDGCIVVGNTIVALKDGATLGDEVYPKKGTYFTWIGNDSYTTRLTINGYTGFLVAKKIDPKWIPDHAHVLGPTPIVTSGDGSEYIVTIDGITELYNGLQFVMLPHTNSTTTAVKLNVNGLGAKTIRQRLSTNTSIGVVGATDNWIVANKPITVTYNGSAWMVELTRPDANNLYGTVKVENGGVPTYAGTTEGSFLRVVDGVPTWTVTNIKGDKVDKGDTGPAYTLNDTDKNAIASAVKASLTKENWTFTLEDGSTVTKAVYVG